MMQATAARGWKRAAISAAVLAWLGSPRASEAADLNGFLREKGHGDLAASFTTESYGRFWVGDTRVDVPNDGSVDTRSLSLWVAYGLTDNLTITANLPYVRSRSDGFDMREEGLQDLELLGEYRLASGGLKARSSLVGAAGVRTIASNYEPNSPVSIGHGTADWIVRLVYQLEYRGFYVSQQVGYDRRGGDAPDAVPLYTEVGVTLGPVTLTGFYSRVRARSGTDIGDPGFTFPSNRIDYDRVGAKVYGRVSRNTGLSGMAFTTLDGRNTGETTGASAGLVVHY